MFSHINGIDLNAGSWFVAFGSTGGGSVSIASEQVILPGMDGGIVVGEREEIPVATLVMNLPAADEGKLKQLLRQCHTLTSGGKTIAGRLQSFETSKEFETQKRIQVSAIFLLTGLFLRGELSQIVASISTDTQTTTVFSGGTAPVRDAVFRVAGQVSNLKITDSAGSFWSYDQAIPAGSFLRFHADTGRAFLTPEDTWTGGTEVTGHIDTGPGPYPLSITPVGFDTPVGNLTITSTNRSGASLTVRGYPAYEL